MDALFSYISQHIHYAPLILFTLFMLAGLNVPISSDLLLLGGGTLASYSHSEYLWPLFFSSLAGCYLAAWEAYWIGRLLGPKLYEVPFFKKWVTKERVERLKNYYIKFGLWALIIGRFCPGGVRNLLFMSSGLTRISFFHFIRCDFIACSLWAPLLFYVGFIFSENWSLVTFYFYRYTELLMIFLSGTVFLFFLLTSWRKPQVEKEAIRE